MSAPVNSCSRCTSYFTSLLLVMLMVLSVIRNGNGLFYTSLTIGLHSGTVLASFPSSVSSSVSGTFSSSADSAAVQIKPAASLAAAASSSSSPFSSSAERVLSPSLASSSALSPSLPSSSSSASSSASSSGSFSSSSSSSPSLSQAVSPSIPCDLDTFAPSGCEDDTGSYCDSSQKCSCKDDHPIRLLGYCLKLKQIGEECYTSAQCKSINNAACYIFGKEYDNERISGGHNVGRQVSNWPTGNCRCNLGHQWDNSSETCIKKTIGSWCSDDWDCIKDKYNTQCSRPANVCECAWGFFYDVKSDSCQTPKLWGQKCISNVDCEAENFICSPTTFKCVCPSGFHFDAIHPGCKVNADSSCERGYRWDEIWGRCIPNRPILPIYPSLTTIHGGRTKSTNDHSGSSVHSSKPDSNGDSGSSSVTTMLILILPNVIAFALILRYCYYRKREEDSNDLTDDLERGTFAIRSAAHLHNFTKFCAYPPYTTTSRTILPASMLKGHHASCLTTTVVGYPGDMAIGTCCGIPSAGVTNATSKLGHTKSTLEAVEETDEPVGSLNQESPQGETAVLTSSSSSPLTTTAAAVNADDDENEMHKSSSPSGCCEEQKNTKNHHLSSSCSPCAARCTPGALDDDALVTCTLHSLSSSPAAAAAATATTSLISECSRVNSRQEEDAINLLNNCPTACTRESSTGNPAISSTISSSSSPASSRSPPAFATCAVKNDKKESDLATPDSINVKATTTTTTTTTTCPLVHCTSNAKVTLVKYSPNSSANKVHLQLVPQSHDTAHQPSVNVDSFSSSINFTSDNIDRTSCHFILREKTTDTSSSPPPSSRDATATATASKSSASCCSGSASSPPATAAHSRKLSPSHEQVPVLQDPPLS